MRSPSRPPALEAVGFALLGVAVGLAAARFGATSALLFGAVAAGVIVMRLDRSRLVSLLVAATFVTVFRVDVLGARLRVEHFVLLALVAVCVRDGRVRGLVNAASDRTILLFGSFVIWNGVVSLLRSPEPRESLPIVGWLALDWLILVVLVGQVDDAKRLAFVGARWAGLAGAIAVLLWIGARAGAWSFGVTQKVIAGVPAAAGFSFEANLLGATMALWAFMAITNAPGLEKRARAFTVAVTLAAMALSFTRAALVGLALGIAVWAVLAGSQAARRTAQLVAAVAAAILVATLIAPGVSRPISETARTALDFSSGSGQQRAEGWRTAIADMHGFDWLVGLGTNSFGQRHLEPTLPTQPTPAYLANLPLQVLYDSGLVGVVLLGATLLSVFTRTLLRDARAPGLLVVYLACASATSPFWYGTTWLLVALAIIQRRSADRTCSMSVAPAEGRRYAGPSVSLGRGARPIALRIEEGGTGHPWPP